MLLPTGSAASSNVQRGPDGTERSVERTGLVVSVDPDREGAGAGR
ncbi:hypothetical protein [Curtobacterium flaccumfaciens]|nr:hypothetical protein [Curtobacterium flaccumfaciens]